MMLKHGVGSVVVVHGGLPAGIITETDALQAGAVTERPFTEVQAGNVTTHPLVTTTPETSVRKVGQQMARKGVKKLPVLDDTTLSGIITQTDIAVHCDDVTAEIREQYHQRDRWDGGDADLDDL